MEKNNVTRFFLGANSARGFFSLYDGFTSPADGDFLWVIKGGPGCGKSTLMRRVGAAAEAAGERVEYIHCSGDPASLDGVWLPERKTGYVDGTAPHVQEALYPGAAAMYLDMGQFLDDRALRGKLPELMELNRRYKALYAQAYGLLAGAAALLPKNTPGQLGPIALQKTEKRAAGFAARELRRRNRRGSATRRFLSALSCQGRVCFTETLAALTPRVCLLDNTLGLGHRFLDRMAALAVERGHDLLLCSDPLEPEKPEALLLPGEKLAFFAGELPPESGLTPWRRLRLDDLADRETLAAQRGSLRERKRESALLLNRAMETLAAAKALHDELEAVYRPHVDFAGADALTQAHIQRLFG